eukprot:g22186.t1
MLLDADKSGLLDLDEFVEGCMQLHGPAKSLQVAKMSHENKVARQQLQELREGLEEEAVPWSRRRNVTLDGVSMPLGIVIGNWGSAKLVSNVYRIIVSEAEEWGKPRPNGARKGMYLLAAHGRGLEQGLALEYYRSYNRSWHQPELYLPLVRDVNHSRLDFCNNSFTTLGAGPKRAQRPPANAAAQGTEQVGDQVHWKCYKDSWWVAPACRTDPEECIAIISKRGWGIIYFPQKAFFFGMGVALTNGLQVHVDEWIHLNHELQGLLYWWSPDSSFIRDPHFHVQFPPHSPAEYRAGTYRTMQKESSLSKFALSKIETEALEVLRQLELDTEEMNDLLEQHANCEEELGHGRVFGHSFSPQSWLKICAAGTGVQFENGSWMDCAISRAHHCGEARCVLCAPGTWSESWEGTFVCKACPAGKVNQFHGQTECVPCEAGHFAAKDAAGSTARHVRRMPRRLAEPRRGGLMSTVASLIADNLTFPLTALHLDSLFFSFQCASNHNPVQVFILSGYRLTFGLALLIPLVHGLWCAWRGLNFFTCHMLTNVVGNCMLAFSTNQMHNLLTPFVCKHHPNRLYTVSLLGMPLPLGFVALCLWLLFSELPKRMLRGDIRFVRRCHFLVGNFRPGAEVSVAIFIARGALSCFVDLVPTVAGKAKLRAVTR